MFNSDQKQRYLRNCKYEESTVELIEKIFISTEFEEKVFNKDVSLFTLEEAMDLLKSFNSKSQKRLIATCIFLSDYFYWCYDEGLTFDLTNSFDNSIIEPIIKNIIPNEMLNQNFFNYNDMLGYLDNIADVRNKFIAYGIYCGIKGSDYEELRNLKIKDLNFEEKTIKLVTGRVAKVDDLLIHLMFETDDQTYYYADGIEKESKFNRYAYAESDYVLKACGIKDPEQVSSRLIMKVLRIIKTQCENEFLSASTLYKNGLINYIKKQYEKKSITLKNALFQELNAKMYVYDAETQMYIKEFGANITVRMLRRELKDYIEIL